MAVIDKDLEAARPSRNVLENLLDNPDENLRMGAACALLKSSGNSHPKIVNLLKKNLLNIKQMSQFPIMVIDVCNAAGPAAKSMVPALLEYARARNADGNEVMSRYAWRTVAKIDPSITNSDAAVAAAVAKEEITMRWRENHRYNNLSYDELTQGLKDRNLAVMAAERLGEMGYAAKDAIPEMLQSLESSLSSGDRDQILAAIHHIDPQVEFTKIPALPIMDGLMAAISALLNQPGPSENESLGLALEQRRHARPMSAWLTKNELQAWTRILATNTIAWQAFSNRVQASNPNLQSLLVPNF